MLRIDFLDLLKELKIIIILYFWRVIDLSYYEMNTYRYLRSKDLLIRDGVENLYVYACINITKEYLVDHYLKEQFIPGPSVLLEIDAQSADPNLLSLPVDSSYILTSEEYKLLEETAKTNKHSFLLFKHVIKN